MSPFLKKNIWVICDHECIIAPIGLSRFSQNLDLLVPVFDGPLLELENIEHQQKKYGDKANDVFKPFVYTSLPKQYCVLQ